MYYIKLVKVTFLTMILLCVCGCETYTSSQPNDYRSMAYQDAVNAGIDPDLFVKQIDQESRFNPYAISPAGAIGIAQFMPDTASGLGIDPWNVDQSLNGAAQLMSRYAAKYGSYKMALAAYNCGSGCLQNAINNYGYWWWGIPLETRDYINKITA
jgi:soluble lytic murein transglycosylase-like protein